MYTCYTNFDFIVSKKRYVGKSFPGVRRRNHRNSRAPEGSFDYDYSRDVSNWEHVVLCCFSQPDDNPDVALCNRLEVLFTLLAGSSKQHGHNGYNEVIGNPIGYSVNWKQ